MVTLFYIMMLAFGVLLSYIGLRDVMEQSRPLRDARPVDATVIASTVERGRSTGRKAGSWFRPVVTFEYLVDGIKQTSDRLGSLGEYGRAGLQEDARSHAGRYAAGSRVIAWLAPGDPPTVFLERRGMPKPYLVAGLGLTFLIVALWMAMSLRWPASTRDASGRLVLRQPARCGNDSSMPQSC